MSQNFMAYNVQDGALEAIVHGMRDGMLRADDYNTICQCETIEDIKIHLASTDYGSFLQNESVLLPLVIFENAQEHYVKTFFELRTASDEPLTTFLDFISYEFIISNVLKLIVGSRQAAGMGENAMEILMKCHPLGVFPGMSALTSAVPANEIFETVLIDSPIGRFFQEANQKDFDELSIEFLRSTLHKNWLEQFYSFCESLGGSTAEVMCDLLAFEADRSVITVTVNTCSMKAAGCSMSSDDRKKLYPNIGRLVDLHDGLSAVETEDELKEKLKAFPEYYEIFDDSKVMIPEGQVSRGGKMAASSAGRSIEKLFREKSIELHKWSFVQQFHYGIFFSYFKLKELEVDNLLWISECIAKSMRHRVNEFTAIF